MSSALLTADADEWGLPLLEFDFLMRWDHEID
jgi:hypothetical protein